MSDTPTPVLSLVDVRKSYNIGSPNEVEILHGINLTVQERDFSALVGPSGSGKSTLLNIIGLLDQPTSGELYILGQPTREMEDEARTALRGNTIGFVFQFHHLIQAFTALENVLMPLMIKNGKPKAEFIERAKGLLDEVGLGSHMNKKPDELSGGQQQRVAIARALITRPALLLADEPTGNLDTKTAAEIFALFRKFNQQFGCAVLLVTHDARLSTTCDRTITLVDGQTVSP
jgi:lipoprotein-releasing system ATP-binding protein